MLADKDYLYQIYELHVSLDSKVRVRVIIIMWQHNLEQCYSILAKCYLFSKNACHIISLHHIYELSLESKDRVGVKVITIMRQHILGQCYS